MGGITKAFFFLVIFLHYNAGFGFKLNTVSKRLDDIELKMLIARNERRTMHYSLENMEGRLNSSLAQEGSSGDEIQHIERKLHEIKELMEPTKLAKISETFHLLRKGFSEEKKQSLRFSRRVSEVEDVLALLSNNSETLTRNVFAFSEDLNQTNEDLRESNRIMKEMYENTSKALLQVTDVLEAMTKNMVNVVSSVLETTLNETMKEYSLEIRQALFPRCQESQLKSCLKLLKCGYTESDVYSVFLGDHAIKVYCDQSTDGGGWTVFQRRQDGSVDFYLGWEKYRNGFGNLHGEFWLGNDNLHRILSIKSGYELRVDLADFDGNTAFAKYNKFMVGPENDNYVLRAEGYSGDAGDSLDYHSGQQFSTKDRDNDGRSWSSCSQARKGAWWYKSCYLSNLNGLYSTDKQSRDSKNVLWTRWKSNYPLKFSEMKFRELM